MRTQAPVVAVTGASGYLGSQICADLGIQRLASDKARPISGPKSWPGTFVRPSHANHGAGEGSPSISECPHTCCIRFVIDKFR